MQVRILYQAVAIITLAAVSFVGSPTAMAQNTCDKVVGNFNWTDPNAWDNCGVTFPNNAGTDNANVQVGGTLTLDQNITINNLTLSTGGIAGDNDLTTNGNLEWTGGAMSGTGTTRAAGGLLLGGTGLKDLQGSRSLVNASGQTANWNDGSVRLLTTNNSLLNEASGTFNISADGSSMFGSGTFDNQGSVIVNLSDAGQTVVIGNAFDNDGTLDVQQGRVDLSGGGTSAGDFAGSADAVLEFGGLTHTLTFGASITATNVEVTGGTVNVGNGTTYNVGNTSVSLAGTLAINDGSQTGTLTITNGALDGNSLFTVTGQTTWSGGAMVGGGTTRAEGGLELSGNALKDMQEGRDLVNVSGQTASWTGGSVRLLTTSNALINEANATFNISADGASLFGSGNFDNDGAIVVNLSDPGQAVVIGADLNNDGSVNAQQGRADLSGGGTSDGSFTGGADGIIEFGGATHNLTANSSVTATNVEVTGGTVNVDGSYNAGNTTISTVGTLTMNVTGQTGTLTQTGGALSGSGEFTASGQTIWNGGAMSGTGTLRAEGGLALGGTSLKDAQGSRTVVNASGQTGSWTQGNVRLLTANNTLVNEASATFNISADGASFFGGGTFDNQGNVIVNLSAPGNAVAVSTAFDNDGSVNAQQGTLDLSGGGDSDGSFTSDANGTIEFGGLTHNLSGSSSVTATNVEVTGGTTNVDGAYNTGATGISGVGTLNMNTDGQTGTLTQTAGALGGSGLFTATGQTTWNGGAMGGTGTTRAEGGLELGTTTLKDMQGSRTLVNVSGQTADWNDGNIRLLGVDTAIVNQASGTFNVTTADVSLFGSGTFENAGTWNVNLQAGDDVAAVSTNVQHDGTANIQNGTLAINSATGTGSWNVDGGRLEVQVNNDVTTTGAITVSNGGEVELESSATLTGSNLTMDDTATLNAALNVEMALSGRIAFAMTDESAWNLDDSASLAMTGGVGAVVGIWDNWGVLEIGGFDLGTDPDNNIGDPQGFIDNFSIPELIIGEGANVWLSDLINNGNRGGPQGQQEALYVDTLTFLDSEGILNQNGLNLYFNTLVGDAGQIIDVQVPIPPAVWLFSSGIAGLLAFRRRRNGSHN
ncbi:MAG: hypothetical protein QNJ73_13195 [Gammaproteobacteria bacterium]|nr:hypothetical protein [Gammaproteobacteria bacterium]